MDVQGLVLRREGAWRGDERVGHPPYGAQLINQFFGDNDKTEVTLGLGAGTVLGNPVLAAGLIAWTAQGVGRAGMACAVASRGVWQ